MFIATRLTGYIGAEVTGIRLTDMLPPLCCEALRQCLWEHHVLVFREQFISLDEQKRLTQMFGELMQVPYITPLADEPTVIAVLKEAHERNTGVFGGDWHSDFSFLANPPAGSVLSAVEVPEVGGDTVWANQVLAYSTLPLALKEFVHARRGVHVGKPYGVKFAPPPETHANASMEMARGDPAADREIEHPAVIAVPGHEDNDERPATGALFVNPIYTTRFADMSESESEKYLLALYWHCTRPDFSYRHRWRAGDVVVWSNRTTLHYATNDYDGERRLLYRTTFAGSPPATV